MKTIFHVMAVATLSFAALAAGPGGGGMQPGGPGGGGSQPGGNQPSGPGGSSATFTFDTFLAASETTYGLIIREGVITGHASPTSATAPSTVTAIADGAFAGCTTLTVIDLSATSITSIPANAFSGCTALTKVVLPGACTAIGAGAFAGCSALESFGFEGVETIGDYAFALSGLASVDLSGVTNVGEGAFACCARLKSANNLSGELPAALFAGDASLAACDLSNVTSFGAASLAGCDALTTVELASSAALGDYALAAGEATVATTLANGSLPTYGDTVFLGREVSYTPVAGAVTRIEASELVTWLLANVGDATIGQPATYNTSDIETWLSDRSNAGTILAFCYADNADVEDQADVLEVDVSDGAPSFTFVTSTSSSVKVAVVGTNDLNGEFSAENLVETNNGDGTRTYTSADADATACFARLQFTKGW